MSNHTNPNWTDELSDQDKIDLASLNVDEPINHTLLEIWKTILDNSSVFAGKRIPPNVAAKIVASWTHLRYQELPIYHELYYSYLTTYGELLNEVIEEFPGCLKNVGDRGAEDSDAVANRKAYLELMYRWHKFNNELMDEWDTASETSHIEVAAIADAAAFTVNSQGLLQHLGQPQIGFVWTDEDQAELNARLFPKEES